LSAPLSSIGEHKRHSSMRLGISRRRLAEQVCERHNQPAIKERLRGIAARREPVRRKHQTRGRNKLKRIAILPAVIRSHPVMALNIAELVKRSPVRSVQMFASFPHSRAAKKRSASRRCKLRWQTFFCPTKRAARSRNTLLPFPLSPSRQMAFYTDRSGVRRSARIPSERNRVFREDLADKPADLRATGLWVECDWNANGG
jgi:hypothetical protein